jgi:hypothetical protein
MNHTNTSAVKTNRPTSYTRARLRWIRLVMAIALGLSSTIVPYGCAGGELVTTGFLARSTVREALRRVDGIVEKGLTNARLTGDALEAKAAADLQLALQNANLMLADSLDKTLDRLESAERNFLQELSATATRFEDMGRLVDTWRADAAIDLSEIVSQIPTTRDLNFKVFRVEGATYFRGSGDLALVLHGVGVADQSSIRTARIGKVCIDGAEVAFKRVERIDNNKVRIVIPSASVLDASGEASQFRFPELSLESHVVTEGFWRTKREDFTFRTTLTIVPSNIGSGELTYSIPQFRWRVVATDQMASVTTLDHSRLKTPVPYSVRLTAPAGQRIRMGSVKPDASCEGHPHRAPWTTLELKPGDPRAPMVEYADAEQEGTQSNYRTAYMDFSAWGRPVKVWLTGDFEAKVPAGVRQVRRPVTVPSQGPCRVSIPSDALTWQLDVTLLTGRKLTLAKGETSPDVSVSETRVGSQTALSFTLRPLPR